MKTDRKPRRKKSEIETEPTKATLTPYDKMWRVQYENVIRFRKLYGRWPHPTERFPGRTQIGQWHYRNRQAFLAGVLKEDRLELLQKIGFSEFSIRLVDCNWEQQFECLKQFRAKHPERWPYTAEEFPKDNRLGRWFHEQRQRHTRGTLKRKWMVRLRSIGFPFQSKVVKRKDLWLQRYEELTAFRRKYQGSWPQKSEHPSSTETLGNWCNAQRWKRRRGVLAKERIRLLDALGFEWEPMEATWTNNYEFLLEFQRKNTGRKPNANSEDGRERSLAAWLTFQKVQLRKGRVAEPKRIRLMKALAIRSK